MRIVFTSGSLYTTLKLEGVSPNQAIKYLEAVRIATSARPQGFKWMPAFKHGTWDGYVRLYKNGKFPTGLLKRVISTIIETVDEGSRPDIVVTRDRSEPNVPYISKHAEMIQPDMFSGITLRDYQVAAARCLLTEGRGIAKMATNSGKTEIMAALARAIPGNALILTTKKDLLYQTRDRLEQRLIEPVGAIGDGGWSMGRVTVGTVQTLTRNDNLSGLGEFSCVMFDECHHVPSATSQKVMMAVHAPYRYGFSGTPLHNDDLSDMVLMGATGPVCVEVTNADLIEAGVSAMPYVEMHLIHSDKGFKESWDKSYSDHIVNNDNRNNIIAKVVKEGNAQATLVLVDRLEHGRKLMDLIPGSIFAHGSLPADERKAILDKLRHGKGAVVVATPIFDEGVDVPSVDLLVLASGGETHIRLLQRIGRGMRRKDSNNILRVVDFVDDTNKFLLNHSKSRAELYEQEGFAVRIVE